MALLLSVPAAGEVSEKTRLALERRIEPSDAVILADPNGQLLVAENADQPLVPASILKLLTSLMAIDVLGFEFRYSTEFYVDPQRNLIIRGYGDPLLVSEVVADISAELAHRLSASSRLNHIELDQSHFVQPLTIPGVSSSSQPYDAPNGALCVNFNTVYFKRINGRYVSAEPQTPLLPFALKKIKARRLKNGRVVLSRLKNENTLYAGMLFRYFLMQQGLRFDGTVRIGTVTASDRLILKYQSPHALPDIISKLLEHSNNFITNQLLISAGVGKYGPPGSLDKGVRALRGFADDRLGLHQIKLVEGSGISRANRISASQMMAVLKHFEPYRHLMRREKNEFYKTGTLRGISTRAGYLLNLKGHRFAFVVMRNTPGNTAQDLMPYLKKLVQGYENN